jgi:hypothetical protein
MFQTCPYKASAARIITNVQLISRKQFAMQHNQDLRYSTVIATKLANCKRTL